MSARRWCSAAAAAVREALSERQRASTRISLDLDRAEAVRVLSVFFHFALEAGLLELESEAHLSALVADQLTRMVTAVQPASSKRPSRAASHSERAPTPSSHNGRALT
jgi:hypothetical protein